MKKLLSIVGSLSLLVTTTGSVIACNYPQNEILLSTYQINLDKELSDLTSDEEVIKLIEKKLENYTDETILKDRDFTIDEIKHDLETNKILGQSILIKHQPDSSFLKEDLIIGLQKDFNYLQNEFLSVKGADLNVWNIIKEKVQAEIKRWAPEAKEGKDYTISESASKKGVWLIHFLSESLVSTGNEAQLVFEINSVDLRKTDLDLIFDADTTSVNDIQNEVIKRMKVIAPYAEFEKDYIINNLKVNENNKVLGGYAFVSAKKESKLLEGFGEFYIKKDFDYLKNFFDEWYSFNQATIDKAEEEIQNEILKWVPEAAAERDFRFERFWIGNNGYLPQSWRLVFVRSSKIMTGPLPLVFSGLGIQS